MRRFRFEGIIETDKEGDTDEIRNLFDLAFDGNAFINEVGTANVTHFKELADRAVEVDLLGDRDDAQAMVTPVAKGVYPVPKGPRKTVEFPDYDGLDLAVEDVTLQFLESGSLQVVAGLPVDVPLDAFQAVALEPPLNLAFLSGFILTRGAHSDVGCNHGCRSRLRGDI